MFYFGCGVLYPKFLTDLLNFMIYCCFFMPGGIFRSAVSKDSLYFCRGKFLKKMVL